MTALEIILTVLTIASGLCAIGFGYDKFARSRKKDDSEEGGIKATILSEIGYIKSGVDDIKDEQKEQRKTNTEFLERLTEVESSTKQAHKRIDGLEHRLDK